MRIFLNILSGFAKVFRYWNIILLLTAIQLLVSWLFALPMIEGFHASWSHSLLPAQTGNGALLGASALEEFLLVDSASLSAFYSTGMLVTLALLYIAASMFVLAGTLPLYSGLDLKFNWERFLSDGARFFRPFLGLALISIIFFLFADFLSASVNTLVNESLADSNDEASRFISGVLFTSLFRFFLFSLVVLIFQYAKIASASDQLRNVLYLIRKAFSFVARHFLKVISAFLIIGLMEFLVQLLDTAVWYYIVPDDSFVIQLIWLVFVTALFVFLKLLYFAVHTIIYNETKRAETEAGSIKVLSQSEGQFSRASRFDELS